MGLLGKGGNFFVFGGYIFITKGQAPREGGLLGEGSHFFCFGGQIPYFHYKGSSTMRRGFLIQKVSHEDAKHDCVA